MCFWSPCVRKVHGKANFINRVARFKWNFQASYHQNHTETSPKIQASGKGDTFFFFFSLFVWGTVVCMHFCSMYIIHSITLLSFYHLCNTSSNRNASVHCRHAVCLHRQFPFVCRNVLHLIQIICYESRSWPPKCIFKLGLFGVKTSTMTVVNFPTPRLLLHRTWSLVPQWASVTDFHHFHHHWGRCGTQLNALPMSPYINNTYESNIKKSRYDSPLLWFFAIGHDLFQHNVIEHDSMWCKMLWGYTSQFGRCPSSMIMCLAPDTPPTHTRHGPEIWQELITYSSTDERTHLRNSLERNIWERI